MDRRFEVMEERFVALQSRMNQRFAGMDRRFDRVYECLDALGGRVERLESAR